MDDSVGTGKSESGERIGGRTRPRPAGARAGREQQCHNRRAMKATIGICFFFVAAPLLAADRIEIGAGPALMFFTGAAHIQRTSDHLRLEPRPAVGASITLSASDHLLFALSASEARMPIVLRGDETHLHGGRARIVPINGALLARCGSDRVQPYAGAGLLFLFVRHANLNPAASDIHARYIEQPDHVALLLEAGLRVPLGFRSSFVIDSKFGPAPSTMEVVADPTNRVHQTNIHPVVLTASLAHHF